jgi:predicted AAA+ superfamily ATPase
MLGRAEDHTEKEKISLILSARQVGKATLIQQVK